MIHLHQDIQGGAQKQIGAKILRIALSWRLLTTQPKLSKASLVITFSTLLCGRGMWVLPLMAAASLSTLTNPSQSTSQWTASSSTWTRTWPTTFSFTSLTSSFSPITPSPCQQLTWFSTLKTSGGTISPSFWRCGEMDKGDDYDRDDEDEHCVHLQVIRHEKLSEAGTGCQADPKYDLPGVPRINRLFMHWFYHGYLRQKMLNDINKSPLVCNAQILERGGGLPYTSNV